MTDVSFTPTYTPTPEDKVNQTFSDLVDLLATTEEQHQRMGGVEGDILEQLNNNYNKLRRLCRKQVGEMPGLDVYRVPACIELVNVLLDRLYDAGFFQVGKAKAKLLQLHEQHTTENAPA